MPTTATLDWRGPQVEQQVAQAVIAATNDVVTEGLGITRQATPVLTGALQREWHAIPTTFNGSVIEGGFENGLDYDLYVELGTWKMAGRHMGQQGADAAYSHLPARIASRLS